MKQQRFTIPELMARMKGTSVHHFIEDQHYRFTERFGLNYDETVKVKLIFEKQADASDFYNELRFNSAYSKQYTVKTDALDAKVLYVEGAETLFDYFGTREPNLLTLSRSLDLAYKIEFLQQYSAIIFTGEVCYGELLGRHCLIEVSEMLPELSLGGLHQIARTSEEFELLLTRVYLIKEEMLR